MKLTLWVAPGVLAHWEQHRQLTHGAPEAGGMLFANVSNERVDVVRVTGPLEGDQASRYSFSADGRRDQSIIDEMYQLGLSYVGDWHSHPEQIPRPSRADLMTLRQVAALNRHRPIPTLLMIVGQAPFPGGLYVAQCDGVAMRQVGMSAK